MAMTLAFRSELAVAPAVLWRDITSMEAINAEMWPLLSMGAPDQVRSIQEVTPGTPLFRSRLKLLTVLPIGASLLTLEQLQAPRGFVEASPMTGMQLWRHERWLEPQAGGVRLHDRLTFTPRWCPRLSRGMVRLFFRHRHRRLRRRYPQ